MPCVYVCPSCRSARGASGQWGLLHRSGRRYVCTAQIAATCPCPQAGRGRECVYDGGGVRGKSSMLDNMYIPLSQWLWQGCVAVTKCVCCIVGRCDVTVHAMQDTSTCHTTHTSLFRGEGCGTVQFSSVQVQHMTVQCHTVQYMYLGKGLKTQH